MDNQGVINNNMNIDKQRDIAQELSSKLWTMCNCQTAHCGRCKPRFVLGEFTSPIVPYRNLPQTPGGMTADCRSLV